MGTYGMNDSNADSLFTRMTSDTFLYMTSWCHSTPGAGKQAGVLSGCEKAQCALRGWSAIPNFFFPPYCYEQNPLSKWPVWCLSELYKTHDII